MQVSISHMDLPITITTRFHSKVCCLTFLVTSVECVWQSPTWAVASLKILSCIWMLIAYFMSNSHLLICFLVPDSSFPLIHLVNIDFCHLTLQAASYGLIICHLSANYTEFGVLIQPILKMRVSSPVLKQWKVICLSTISNLHLSGHWCAHGPPPAPLWGAVEDMPSYRNHIWLFSLKRKKRFLFFILNCELWSMSMRLSLFMLQETRPIARRSLGDPTKPYSPSL